MHGGTNSFFVVSCRMCQSCFAAFRGKAMVAAFRLRPAGLSLLRQGAETHVSVCDNQIWSVDSC